MLTMHKTMFGLLVSSQFHKIIRISREQVYRLAESIFLNFERVFFSMVIFLNFDPTKF